MKKTATPLASLPAVLITAATLAIAVLALAWRAFHLGDYDLRVPLTYAEGDSVVMTMYAKGLLQDGWPNNITHLSAPYTYPGAAFPLMTSTDWVVMKAMSLFTQEAGLLVNAFWLFTLVASAWTAAYAAWQMRLSPALSAMTGMLYAFLPFAMMRSTHHLNLVYHLVPLLCLLAIVIAAHGDGLRHPRQAIWVGLAACLLQGFDYVYYSFFSVLLFGAAALIGWRRHLWRTEWKRLWLPATAIAIVGLSTALNLAPALQTWHDDGRPAEMGYKSVAESEIYGAKLRRMLMPSVHTQIAPLAALNRLDDEAAFPFENENQTARLGFYGAFGLFALMMTLARRRDPIAASPARHAACGLGLFTFLAITVGGLGAVINLLSVPDIRAYNRFSVFLSFFALCGTGFWIQTRLVGLALHWRIACWCAVIAFAGFSLYDQLLDRAPTLAQLAANQQRADAERAAVTRLESALPPEAAVLQLPMTGYPPLSIHHRMQSYDHGRAYLWSQKLKWSWPSFSQRHRGWQDRVAGLQGAALLKAAALSGFDAIWIDRAAWADGGKATIEALRQAGAVPLDLRSARYAALDLREYATMLRVDLGSAEFRQQAAVLLDNDTFLEWKSGTYDEERNPEGRRFRWAQQEAVLVAGNAGDKMVSTCARFTIGSGREGQVRLDGVDTPSLMNVSGKAENYFLPLHLGPHERRTLRFTAGMPRIDAPGDRRKLYFYLMEFGLAACPPAATH